MTIGSIELLNVIIDNKLTDIHISIPAKIVSYDYTKQKAKVQPLLNEKYNDGEIKKPPVIHNVPVIHPASGGASITFPVAVGDKVLLSFSEKSLEEWLVNGEQVTPEDPRRNDLTDAVAIIGLRDFRSVSPANNNTDLLVKYEGSELKLKPSGVIDITSSNLNMTVDNINVTGEVNISGNVTISGNLKADNVEATSELKGATASIGGKAFASHTHTGVTPGGSITGSVT